MGFVFSQVKIGDYEFIHNPEVIGDKNELLQTITESLNGTSHVSYVPKSHTETDEIKRKRTFTISGTDITREQVEAIKSELVKAPPLYFRNAKSEEFQVIVVSDISTDLNASTWENRPFTFSVKEF